MIDTDVAVRHGFWNDVLQKARSSKVNLAHSTRCFEYWLLLHLKLTTWSDLADGDAAKRVFRDELGKDYSTNCEVTRRTFETLLSKWPTAVKNAQQVRKLHESANTPVPANPSTNVDLIACAMNDSAPPHLRKVPCTET